MIVALLSCFSDVVFSLSIDSPELDNETLEVPELRRSNSETKTGIDFDAFFLTMENAVDQVSEKSKIRSCIQLPLVLIIIRSR